MKTDQRNEFLYQTLETELGGVEIYSAALKCVVNADLKKGWRKNHDFMSSLTINLRVADIRFDDKKYGNRS